MFQKSVTGSASPFEHLAARLNLTSAKKAEDDEDKKKDAKADDEGDDSKDKAKKSKKAEGDKDDSDSDKDVAKADSDGDDDDEKPAPRSKKKSKASEDDKDDKDDNEDKKEARAAERERIAAIILSPEANASNACFKAAVRLALKSNMTADEVLSILELNAPSAETPAPKKDTSARDTLAQRMSQSPNPDLGVDGSGGSEPTLAEKIIMAGKKRRGEI
jgi:hypothetical protein